MALNLVFDWATISKMLQITSSLHWSFRLKLLTIGLSCTLISLLFVTPTTAYSLQFLRPYSNKSHILSKKCVTGLESGGGGNNRTESWVPAILKHLYCPLISPSTVNLWLISTLQREIRKILNSGDKILKRNMGWSPSPDYSHDPSTTLSEKWGFSPICTLHM